MKWSKAISPSSPRVQEIEFAVLLGWALLFPAKQTYAYYLGFVSILTVFTLRKAVAAKNITVNRFFCFLLLLNAMFIFSAFFSAHPFKSLLFVADVFMLSWWFIFFYLEREGVIRYVRLAAWVISLSSLAVVALFAAQAGRLPVTPCFKNPILQGIASALAALVFLHALLKRYQHVELLLLALNVLAVVICASKAAFLGLAAFAAAMILRGRRRWLPYLVLVLLLVLVAPTPLRRMVGHSLRHDPYVLNRLDIWNMSARMFRRHFWTGVGPDLFPEAAPRFNFPQEGGPARYFKLPESPHSDYWKIISENGLPGLIAVLLFLFFSIRRLLSPPRFHLPKLLLAFLLAEILLFNCAFNFFFLMLLFLLLHDSLWARGRFVSLQHGFKVLAAALLMFSALVLYLFPFLADRLMDSASREPDPVRRFEMLRRAGLLSPLDERVPLAKAGLLRAFARSRHSMEAWGDAVDCLRAAQGLNRNSGEALLMESELFREFPGGQAVYPAQGAEVLAPLSKAEKLAPCNPFLKLEQAVILRAFGHEADARRQAEAALDLEPEYVAAILFLHDLNGGAADDPRLGKRIARIREKARRLGASPGSYLFRLHRLPAATRMSERPEQDLPRG